MTSCSEDKPNPQPTEEPKPAPVPEGWPRIESVIPKDEALEAKVDALLKAMTLEEKVGQMTQPEIRAITAEEVKQYHIGSVLNGGGSWPGGNKHAAPCRTGSPSPTRYWAASMDRPTPHEDPHHLGHRRRARPQQRVRRDDLPAQHRPGRRA